VVETQLAEVDSLIQRLHLQPHPEGGYYRETYASEVEAPTASGVRRCATSIYYLLANGDRSAFHRLQSDEIWYFHAGCGLVIHVLDPAGHHYQYRLSPDIAGGGAPQVVIRAGLWFGAELQEPNGYCLVGCSVSPGFHFSDLELARRDALIQEYPQHESLIRHLTR
jgi:predicted cupin superfamily sugar epimerase